MMKQHIARTPDHISHVLNLSKTKAAYSFQKTDRFTPNKSYLISHPASLPINSTNSLVLSALDHTLPNAV